MISTANTRTDGGGTIVSIFGISAGTYNGNKIKSITVKALQNTHEGMIRLFITNDGGTTYFLYREICIPETAPTAYAPSFEYTIDECLSLTDGYGIGASTDKAEPFAVTIEGEGWLYPIS